MSRPSSLEDLAAQSCEPCRGGTPRMSEAEAEAARAGTPAWKMLQGARGIERRLSFRTYAESLAFVQRLSEIAEAENHHPDVCFGWGYARVTLRSHAIDGLHRNDFIMAAKIDRLLP